MRKSILRASIVALAISAPLTYAIAKEPAKNVSVAKHPNLSAAQDLIGKAFEKIEAAQKANEYDLGGHAAKAKDALKIAADELKLAAETANAKK